MVRESLNRKAPRWLFGIGLLLFVCGYALLQYIPADDMQGPLGRKPPYALQGSVLFMCGFLSLLAGVGMWLTQPAERRQHVHRDEEVEAEDVEDDDDDDMIPCPHCQKPIYEESERCPYCEKYILAEDAPPRIPPLWFAIAFIAALGISIWWIFARQ